MKGDRLHLAELQKIQISKKDKKGKFAVTDVFGGNFVRVVSITEKDEGLWKKKILEGKICCPATFPNKISATFSHFNCYDNFPLIYLVLAKPYLIRIA